MPNNQLIQALNQYLSWLNQTVEAGSLTPSLYKKLLGLGRAIEACMIEFIQISEKDSIALIKCLELIQSIVSSPQVNNSKELSDLGLNIYEDSQKSQWKTIGLELVNIGISALMFVSIFNPVFIPASASIGLYIAQSVLETLIEYLKKSEKLNPSSHREFEDDIESSMQKNFLKN